MRSSVYLINEINDRGDFRNLDKIDAIFKKIEILLLTPKNTHPFDPSYGNNLLKLLFDFNDDETLNNINAEIEELINEISTNIHVEVDTNFVTISKRNGFISNIKISIGKRKKEFNLLSNGISLKMV